jgi:hypothetical protein
MDDTGMEHDVIELYSGNGFYAEENRRRVIDWLRIQRSMAWEQGYSARIDDEIPVMDRQRNPYGIPDGKPNKETTEDE